MGEICFIAKVLKYLIFSVCSDLFDFSDPKEAERFLAGIKEYAVKFKENDRNLIPNVGVYEHQRSKESKFLSSL